jgi:hypothetical protein
VNNDMRAPPAPVMLMCALSSAREDLRRHGTCAPMAIRVSDAPDGDGRWTDGEKASGVGDWDAGERRRERGHAAWPRSVAELGCYTRVFHVNKILQCKSL